MFDHEKLRVYQEALQFASMTEPFRERIGFSGPVRDQLERAGYSILLNIAEGNGRFTPTDRCRFFDMAKGSALECAACLDLFALKKVIPPAKLEKSKQSLEKIVSMLVGLIRSNSPSRLHEDSIPYAVNTDQD